MQNQTITIRLTNALRETLDLRAKAEGRKLSDLVREILEAGATPKPVTLSVKQTPKAKAKAKAKVKTK